MPVIKRLLQEYKASKISTYAMEKKLGIERSCILRWRKGINSPTLHTAEAFAEIVGCELVLIKKDPPKDYRKWLNT